jgi:hypothetical protein
MKFKKRPPIEGFLGGQYGFSKHVHQHTAKLGQKRDNFPKTERFSKLISTVQLFEDQKAEGVC